MGTDSRKEEREARLDIDRPSQGVSVRSLEPAASFSRCRIGTVASVVTIAITTNIVNRAGDSNPKSSPTFRTINSINPRVFNNTPSDAASRQSDPVSPVSTRSNPLQAPVQP